MHFRFTVYDLMGDAGCLCLTSPSEGPPLSMNKNELEFERANLSAMKFREVMSLARTVIMAGAGVWAISLIMGGLSDMILGQTPDGIGALAKVVEALKLGEMVGYLWGAIASVAWGIERRGKQRIVREKGRLQSQVEASDAYRSSSGLDPAGQTPRGK